MKYIKKISIVSLMMLAFVPVLSLGAATTQATPLQTQYSNGLQKGQGLGEGINQNRKTTGFFKDAIYPLKGDFDAATYDGHSMPGALDFTKGNNTYGQPIYAVKSGTVEIAKSGCSVGYIGNSCNGGYGNHVKINHGSGYETLYAHMIPGSIQVKQGDKVQKGDVIGYVGSTGNSSGPHLHFEVRSNGVSQEVTKYFDVPNVIYH